MEGMGLGSWDDQGGSSHRPDVSQRGPWVCTVFGSTLVVVVVSEPLFSVWSLFVVASLVSFGP